MECKEQARQVEFNAQNLESIKCTSLNETNGEKADVTF